MIRNIRGHLRINICCATSVYNDVYTIQQEHLIIVQMQKPK